MKRGPFPPRGGRPNARPERRGPPAGESTELVYGLRATLAACAARPGDVVDVSYAPEAAHDLGDALVALRARGVRPRELPSRELDRIARSPQHEGIVVAMRPRRWAPPKDLADLLVDGRRTCVALDRVRNSYNIGAVLRSAAFFGVDAVLLGTPAPHPGLEPNAVRVAEGGAEHVVLARTTDLADTLSRLRARGVRVVGADGHATADALRHPFPRPVVLVLGNEREGLGARVRAVCDDIVAIRGSGAIESLNVGVAAGVLIAQLTAR